MRHRRLQGVKAIIERRVFDLPRLDPGAHLRHRFGQTSTDPAHVERANHGVNVAAFSVSVGAVPLILINPGFAFLPVTAAPPPGESQLVARSAKGGPIAPFHSRICRAGACKRYRNRLRRKNLSGRDR